MRAFFRRLFWSVFTFLYVISPIDLLPDFIIGPGWIDDLLVLIYGVLQVRAARAEAESQSALTSR